MKCRASNTPQHLAQYVTVVLKRQRTAIAEYQALQHVRTMLGLLHIYRVFGSSPLNHVAS